MGIIPIKPKKQVSKFIVYLSRSTYAKAGILPIRVAGIFMPATFIHGSVPP